jgi:hypothetical protein
VSPIPRIVETLRRRPDAALALGIFTIAVVIVAVLWSEEHRAGLAINCEPSPALDADGPTRTLYLVRVASTPSPEDTCAELRRAAERLREG